MTSDTLIRSDQISFNYSSEKTLFNQVSFSIDSGRFYLVRGPSGSGKSSFLRLLNRLEEPSGGQLLFKNIPYTQITATELRRQVLYIQQSPVVIDGTVRENLLLPFVFKNNKQLPRPDDALIQTFFKQFNLESVSLEKPAKNLSVGQQQRICLIRGLLLAPSVILLDEPTSALDNESSESVERMAESLCMDHGKAVVLVSHREFTPQRVNPTIISIADGHVKIFSH